jgi:hypothetical protein
MAKLNRLRSNVIATQNASWSNSLYPLVATLDEAGYEVQGATDEQVEEHLHCYGGAGRTPTMLDESPYESPIGRRRDQHESGSILIHAERWRQREEEGWTEDHDDEHAEGDLYEAAIAYLLAVGEPIDNPPPDVWPWDASWWKPTEDPVRQLVKAGALVAAEIDRRLRSIPPDEPSSEEPKSCPPHGPDVVQSGHVIVCGRCGKPLDSDESNG